MEIIVKGKYSDIELFLDVDVIGNLVGTLVEIPVKVMGKAELTRKGWALCEQLKVLYLKEEQAKNAEISKHIVEEENYGAVREPDLDDIPWGDE